ncbi:MAG: membrane protein insertase YidC [Sphingomonadales bacterium]|nr:membrane protein insertase YidC [Sphingomonadales bacterium]
MENQRNIIVAIVLSALVLFGWPVLAERFFPQPKPVEQAASAPAAASGAPTAAAPVKLKDRAAVIAATPRLPIETAALRGSINLAGAQLDDLVLVRHRESVKKDSAPVRLLSPGGAEGSYFARFGWTGDGVALPGADTVWTAEGAKLTPETPVTLKWDNGAGQIFSIRIAVDQDYLFSVEQSVANSGAGAVALANYGLVSREKTKVASGSSLVPNKDVDSWTLHIGPIGQFDDAVNYEVDYSTLDEEGAKGSRFGANTGWLGFGETYWLTALVPAKGGVAESGFRHSPTSYQADFGSKPVVVAPGKAVSAKSQFFAGAKEINVLDRYEEGGIPLFGKSIDWGWFEVIEKPIFRLLDWLFKAVGNFGFAIILMTFVVRGLMFPIAQRQFASMAAMRGVQPKMKAIQERFKDDKQRQQQEIMKLYQTEKINPLAGCLPIFLQIPVFYGLYKVLMVTIEMRHAPFIGWLKDLSAPDPLTPVNLFGLLDFTPPSFLALGILPILLGITMYLQFKLNPAPMDPAQAQVFAIMPWIMMFMMAPFASGLQLYWTVSNLLTIAQQKWLYSRHPALTEPVKT